MVDVVVGLIDITLSPWYFNQFLSKTQSLMDPFCESDLVPGGMAPQSSILQGSSDFGGSCFARVEF